MKISITHIPSLLLLGPLSAVADIASGAEPGNWKPFISASPFYQGNTDVDNGDRFHVSGVLLRGGAFYELGGGNQAGVALNYDYRDYSFSNSSTLGTPAPWGTVLRYGVTAPFSFAANDGWTIGFTPSVDWFREKGANSGDSLVWGVMASGTKQFEDGNRLGLGAGIFSQIQKTSAFPFLVVDWRFNNGWRLVNPLPSGPTGPAGLELDYRIDDGWTAGVGLAYRVLRFRLSDTGPVSNGVGQESGVPVFLRVTRNFTKQMALHLYGGVVTGGKLRIENSSGDKLRELKFDPAPLFGVSLVGRF